MSLPEWKDLPVKLVLEIDCADISMCCKALEAAAKEVATKFPETGHVVGEGDFKSGPHWKFKVVHASCLLELAGLKPN